jgi:hypothetical protein
MSNPDHQDMIRAAALVLQHGSIPEAAAQMGWNPSIFKQLVHRAIQFGYLRTQEAPARPQEAAGRRVLFIGDIHLPYEHEDALAFICAMRDKYKPDEIVLAGDELDQHSISQHGSDPNGQSPGDELEMGLAKIAHWYKEFPVAKVCTSNHGSRPYRRAYLSGLPTQYLRDFKEFMRAPDGWEWRDEWTVSGTVFSHGESASGPNGVLQLAIRQGKSQAVGHFHGSAGASFFHNGEKTVFGLYSGCLISPGSFAFRYGKHSKMKPIIGSAIVDGDVPMFVPMPMDKHGRWTGKL